jgi:hypothetical protein
MELQSIHGNLHGLYIGIARRARDGDHITELSKDNFHSHSNFTYHHHVTCPPPHQTLPTPLCLFSHHLNFSLPYRHLPNRLLHRENSNQATLTHPHHFHNHALGKCPLINPKSLATTLSCAASTSLWAAAVGTVTRMARDARRMRGVGWVRRRMEVARRLLVGLCWVLR